MLVDPEIRKVTGTGGASEAAAQEVTSNTQSAASPARQPFNNPERLWPVCDRATVARSQTGHSQHGVR